VTWNKLKLLFTQSSSRAKILINPNFFSFLNETFYGIFVNIFENQHKTVKKKMFSYDNGHFSYFWTQKTGLGKTVKNTEK
jgi:hypothetical protein